MRPYQFWTYILTNQSRSVLYTGITNNLAARLLEHWIGKEGCFTTRYHVYYLLWSEETKYVNNAIAREKEIKRWHRKDKEALINALNPDWDFWNTKVLGHWPPTEAQMEAVKSRWRSIGDEKLMKDKMSFQWQISREDPEQT